MCLPLVKSCFARIMWPFLLMQVKRREAMAFVDTMRHGREGGPSIGIDPHILAGRKSGIDYMIFAKQENAAIEICMRIQWATVDSIGHFIVRFEHPGW